MTRVADFIFNHLHYIMPTITIDLPDNLNVPANWDARTFFVTKMHEAGFLSSDQAVRTAEDDVSANDTKQESWFTPEQHAQFRENRRKLEEEWAKNPRTEEGQEELYRLLLNGPVADEETIKMQDEVREHMRQWKLPR